MLTPSLVFAYWTCSSISLPPASAPHTLGACPTAPLAPLLPPRRTRCHHHSWSAPSATRTPRSHRHSLCLRCERLRSPACRRSRPLPSPAPPGVDPSQR